MAKIEKFGRKYLLKVDTTDGNSIEISNPLTLEFNCQRNNLASANSANFKIYNLSEKNRNRIYKDKYDTLTYRKVELKAGYEEDSPIIFKGNISHAFSYRNGVDLITEIEAYDGGFAITNSVSAMTIGQGESQTNVLQNLVNDLQNVKNNKMGNFSKENLRGRVVFGNTAEIIKTETKDNFFIDNEEAILINRNEVIEGDISLIKAETGLLESPKRSDTQVVFKMLFEPRFKVGQIIELDSVINSIYNGQYKIIGFTHSGIISDAVGGACETTVNLWLGTSPLTVV